MPLLTIDPSTCGVRKGRRGCSGNAANPEERHGNSEASPNLLGRHLGEERAVNGEVATNAEPLCE